MRITTIGFDTIHFSFLHQIRKAALASMVLCTCYSASAQHPQYKITAALDTAAHTLKGTIDITYTNHSSKTLDRLGIHLWPNAYSNRNTAYAKQMLNLGKLDFQRARMSNLGGLSGLLFTSSDNEARLDIDSNNIDIGWIMLSKPLLPGESIHVSSPYTLKIPVSFSRLGRTGDSYQLTQWYPHIAVLDENGWNMMPYLDQGEYFNDFADYDVMIETPAGYTVAATGITSSTPGPNNKTQWNCKAENVIDFAWFASPTFRHETYLVDAGSSQPVELHLYIDSLGNELWDSASVYAQRALKYYSDWLGPYPYPQMSIVYAPLSSGGYMEYPMVAQIGYTYERDYLDITIAHEIGHMWLYAVLANNERLYPWLDEGLNTFIERRYTQEYYPGFKEEYISSSFDSRSSMSQQDAFQHFTRFKNKLQPPRADPALQREDQYLFSAYVLPPEGLEIMMDMYGQDTMKEMFRQYFSDHKFTLVTSVKMRQSFETACHCDLGWFFEDWIHHADEVDYRVRKFEPKTKLIIVKNKGNISIPVKISSYSNGRLLEGKWVDGFNGEKSIHLEKEMDEVHLYDDFMVINKAWRGNVKPRSVLPQVSILPKIGSYDVPVLSITPFFGKNIADGFMPGVAITGGLLPQQHFKFVIAPMYGIDSKELRGHAEVRYIGDFANGPFDKFLLSLGIDDFGYNFDEDYLFRDHYIKWSPIAALRAAPHDKYSHIIQWWQYRFVHIDQYYGTGIDIDQNTYLMEKQEYGVHELSYRRSSDIVTHPYTIKANLQTGQGFVRLNLRYKQHLAGKDKHHGIWFQGYGGWLPLYAQPTAYVPFTFSGISSDGFFSKDYMFDEWLPGRNALDGLASHQVFEKDANLKTLAYNGISEDWMLGGGMSVALPLRYFHIYMDAAFYPDGITRKPILSYSGGLSIVLWKDVFEIYIPILESQDIRESLSYDIREVWYERISFQANFKLANPLNLVDHYQLGY
jgi:hypothetical protein